jgi:hypothetical protein
MYYSYIRKGWKPMDREDLIKTSGCEISENTVIGAKNKKRFGILHMVIPVVIFSLIKLWKK